ncbi:MAG: diaminopimelate epimerase [Planctomycetota bacterium]|jgi:diaminopimelate epimerase
MDSANQPTIHFTKMHGLGNDYVYVDTSKVPIDGPAELARVISDRRLGIGSDGLILIHPSDVADVRMEMYNADGSRAQMCGNGIRCVAKYVVDHGLAAGPELRIDTDDGVKPATCVITRNSEGKGGVVTAVRVSMGRPRFAPGEIPTTIKGERIVDRPIEVAGHAFQVTCVSMGNPHAVAFVEDLDSIPLYTVGPALERAAEFPERINAHFVRVDSPAHLTVLTWERGSGPTKACGTGACAVVVAAASTGRSDRKVTTTLPGGDLQIEWSDDDEVYMTGPAVEVFQGRYPVPPAD